MISIIDIMIVDDEAAIVALFTRVCVNDGHNVMSTAANGQEALDRISLMRIKPAILILDHRMPIKGGLEVLTVVKSTYPQIKVIILTADSSIRDEALKIGADLVLVKPLTLKEFREGLEAIIGKIGTEVIT